MKEEAFLPGLDAWLASLFDDDHLDETCVALAGSSEPDPEAEKREAQLRAAIADCDRKIRNYRQLLDDEESVALAAQWIAETQRERNALEQQLGRHIPGGELTTKEVKARVDALRDIVSVLAAADPEDKSELYARLGVSLSYDPTGNVTVKAEPRGVTVRTSTCRRTEAPTEHTRRPLGARDRRVGTGGLTSTHSHSCIEIRSRRVSLRNSLGARPCSTGSRRLKPSD